MLGTIIGVATSLWSCTQSTESNNIPNGIDHVIVIGVDGMSPNGIQKANTPTLDTMIANGASTMYARSVLPSSSSSNWASMIMGADTEQHGVTSNGWEITDHVLPTMVATKNGRFPTIFTLLRDQKPKSHIGAIYDWDGFGRLFDKEEVDFDIDGDHEDGTIKDVISYLEKHQPDFTFVHLDHVDHAGHSMGHGSSEYYKSVEKADLLISKVIEATKKNGMYNKTLFIVSADHGGLGYGHGGESLAEVEIPFVMFGAGIKKGYAIEETVYQYDNAATVAYAFGLETPQAWIGRPVKGAFIGNPKPTLRYQRVEQTVAPKILPDMGYFEASGGVYKADSVAVVMQNPSNKGEVRFVINQKEISFENSTVYKDTFYIKQTSLIKAAVFEKGMQKSKLTLGNFRIAPKDKENPVKYQIYYGQKLEKLPDFNSLSVIKEGATLNFSHKNVIKEGIKSEQVAIVYQSYLQIDKPGKYHFFTNSDDGSKLYVNNRLIVDNDGDHGVQERSGSIELTKGKHLIKVEFFNGGGGYHLDVKYKGNEVLKQIIPIDKLHLTK